MRTTCAAVKRGKCSWAAIPYRGLHPPFVLNFPTKKHWRSPSRLEDIARGLDYLREHYEAWGITSLAVPPLGCGHGQLEWRVVGPSSTGS